MMPGSRRTLSTATTWLIRAFSPGCPTLLRSQTTKAAKGGQQLTIIYDLPDDAALTRADELARSARSLRLIRIGTTIVRELTAQVCGEHRTLKVEALLGADALEGPTE